jgi:hypothetical protein
MHEQLPPSCWDSYNPCYGVNAEHASCSDDPRFKPSDCRLTRLTKRAASCRWRCSQERHQRCCRCCSGCTQRQPGAAALPLIDTSIAQDDACCGNVSMIEHGTPLTRAAAVYIACILQLNSTSQFGLLLPRIKRVVALLLWQISNPIAQADSVW